MSLAKDPVALMRLVEVDSIMELDRVMTRAHLSPDDTIVETKFNGWLAQAAGGRLYSRRGEDLTDKFPHIAALIRPFTQEHLIGELVYFDEHGIMREPSVTRVAGTADPREAIKKLNAMPGHFDYVVFDILAANGEDISQASTSARRAVLDDCLCGSGLTISNPLPFSMLEQVYEAGVAAGGDGVIIKNLHAPYIWKPLGQSEARPYATWWKLKPSFTDDFVVTRSKRGPKGKLVVTLAQHHNRRLIEVGDMNNFAAPMEAEILSRLEEGPFVVEVEYTSRFPDPPGALQHPRLVRIREDKPMESVLLPDKYAPNGPVMGVAFPGFRNFWITPNGQLLTFDDLESHDRRIREEGYKSSLEALKDGWIRGFEYNDIIKTEVYAILDERVVERLLEFFNNHLNAYGSIEAIIEFNHPKSAWFEISTFKYSNSIEDQVREGIQRTLTFGA